MTGAASTVNLSEDNLKTLTKKIHTAMEPHLLADIVSRHPGEFASYDHTFKLALRSTDADAKAVVFFLGEEHSCFWYGSTPSTSEADLWPAHLTCQKRFVRLGVSPPTPSSCCAHSRLSRTDLGPAHQVSGLLKWWYSDRCCNGIDASKLHTHPVAMAYPGVERAPRSDTFHDTQGITQQTNGASGDMDRFSRYIGERFAQTLDEDVDGVCAYLEETKGIGRYTVEASRLAFANYRDQGQIRTFSPQVQIAPPPPKQPTHISSLHLPHHLFTSTIHTDLFTPTYSHPLTSDVMIVA